MQKSVHTPEYAALRKELRSVRIKAGLSLRDLAVRLAVVPSWIAKVESGERRIDFVELVWFLHACDANPGPVLERLLSQVAPNRKPTKGGRST